MENLNWLNLEWVANFLSGKAEAERVIFEDPHPVTGFVLAPDLKWDGLDPAALYATAIVHASNIRSLRSAPSLSFPSPHSLPARTSPLPTRHDAVHTGYLR